MQNKTTTLRAIGITTMVLAAPIESHSVELYGIVDAFVGTSKPSGAPGTTVVLDSGGMTTSFWGMTGREDLGSGLAANFRLEGYFLTDTGLGGRSVTDTLLSRNAYVGLESKLGELRLGRLANPMFLATSQFDAFGGSTKFSPLMLPLWAPQFGRYISGDTAWNNALGYYTPDFGGLSGRFLYALGEAQGTNSSNNAVAMLYFNRGPMTATAAYQRTRVGPGLPTGAWAQSVITAGAAYGFGFIKPLLQYVGTRTSGTSTRTDTYQVGATIPFMSGKFMLSAVQTNISADNAVDRRRRNFGFGYLYSFSKRTDIYANALYDKITGAGGGLSTGVGIRHKF